MAKGYAEAMLFAETYDIDDEDNDLSFRDYGYSDISCLTEHAKNLISDKCERFLDIVALKLYKERNDLDQEQAWQLGADLYYDSNGHGTGAKDRDYYSRELANYLCSTASNHKIFHSVFPHMGKNNQVEVELC